MLGYSKEGKLCLEDTDGKVDLDFSHLVRAKFDLHDFILYSRLPVKDIPSEGFFTEGCFALIEGDYTEEETLTVIAIGHPPCERREVAR